MCDELLLVENATRYLVLAQELWYPVLHKLTYSSCMIMNKLNSARVITCLFHQQTIVFRLISELDFFAPGFVEYDLEELIVLVDRVSHFNHVLHHTHVFNDSFESLG